MVADGEKKETNNQLYDPGIQYSSASSAHVFKFGVKQIANARCWYFPAAFASVYVRKLDPIHLAGKLLRHSTDG